MSSDHFEHSLPRHAHHAPDIASGNGWHAHATGITEPYAFGEANAAVSITHLIELGVTASNLPVALTGHYQSLIEGHPASIKRG